MPDSLTVCLLSATVQVVRLGASFNSVVLSLDSLAEAISWDALELPILCANKEDATRIQQIIDGLADVPHDEPWNVHVVGNHLDPGAAGSHGNSNNDDLQWQPRYHCAARCAQPLFQLLTVGI